MKVKVKCMRHSFKLKRWLERQVSEIKQVITEHCESLVCNLRAACLCLLLCALDFKILPDNEYFAEANVKVLSFMQMKTGNLVK